MTVSLSRQAPVMAAYGEWLWISTPRSSPLTFRAADWEHAKLEWEVDKSYTSEGLIYPLHCLAVDNGTAFLYWTDRHGKRQYHVHSPDDRKGYTEVDG